MPWYQLSLNFNIKSGIIMNTDSEKILSELAPAIIKGLDTPDDKIIIGDLQIQVYE